MSPAYLLIKGKEEESVNIFQKLKGRFTHSTQVIHIVIRIASDYKGPIPLGYFLVERLDGVYSNCRMLMPDWLKLRALSIRNLRKNLN